MHLAFSLRKRKPTRLVVNFSLQACKWSTCRTPMTFDPRRRSSFDRHRASFLSLQMISVLVCPATGRYFPEDCSGWLDKVSYIMPFVSVNTHWSGLQYLVDVLNHPQRGEEEQIDKAVALMRKLDLKDFTVYQIQNPGELGSRDPDDRCNALRPQQQSGQGNIRLNLLWNLVEFDLHGQLPNVGRDMKLTCVLLCIESFAETLCYTTGPCSWRGWVARGQRWNATWWRRHETVSPGGINLQFCVELTTYLHFILLGRVEFMFLHVLWSMRSLSCVSSRMPEKS